MDGQLLPVSLKYGSTVGQLSGGNSSNNGQHAQSFTQQHSESTREKHLTVFQLQAFFVGITAYCQQYSITSSANC
jgi:hypothetical protein